MRFVDVIRKKRDGEALSEEEIEAFVSAYTAGEIPDYQASAFLMACFLRGLNDEETSALTDAMMHSGEVIEWKLPHTVDKHSTGGVGDGVSLAIAPIVAACGGKVAMMSGRGLGHTGGTLDKLESIPGYCAQISADRFQEIVKEVGASIIGQTERLAPADKKLYALRDATGTVESIPLITASILGKKLAEGVDALVLDVKAGSGAFMKTEAEAKQLAKTMCAIAGKAGRRVSAFVTDMDRPLGNAVGNSLEVIEAIECLKGKAPDDYTELVYALSAEMLCLCGVADERDCRERVVRSVEDGSALQTFRRMVEMHGGDVSYIDDPSKFPRAKHERVVCAPRDGYIASIDTERYGLAALLLGAGRNRKEDAIDHAAGISVLKNTGDFVRLGEPIAILYSNDEGRLKEGEQTLLGAISYEERQTPRKPLILLKIV